MAYKHSTHADIVRIRDLMLDPTNVGNLARGLRFLETVQSVTSAINPNCIPDLGSKPSADNIRTYALALFIELGEFIQEFDWKPWKEARGIDRGRITDEFADILAFLGIFLVYMSRMGISMEDLAARYVVKTQVNIARFIGEVPGYKVNQSPEDRQWIQDELFKLEGGDLDA